MAKFLLEHDWINYYDMDDADEQWMYIEDLIASFLDKHCPIKHFTYKDYNNQWMAPEILTLINQRDYHSDRFRKFKNAPDLRKAKALRCQINKAVRAARAKFVKRKLFESRKDPKKFWSHINCLIKAPKENVTPVLVDQESNVIVQDVPEYFNTFFSKIGETLFTRKNINPPIPTQIDFTLLNEEQSPIFHPENIKFHIKEIDVTKSSGIKNISSQVLKDVLTTIPIQFTHLCNSSIRKGTFPSSWSTANITPIPKSGNLNDVSNWRPISNLSIPSKLMEK